MIIAQAIAVVLITGEPGASAPQSAAPSYQVLGAGATTCADWNDFKRQDDPARYGAMDWVLGYVSAFNNFRAGDGDVSRSVGVDQMLIWIDQYCDRHPVDSLLQATTSLLTTLCRCGPTGP
jgi:hypothetical protein